MKTVVKRKSFSFLKKSLSLILVVATLFCALVIPAGASKQNKQNIISGDNFGFMDGNSIIIFVTGIGQSWSYYFDDEYVKDGAFESGTLQDYENYAPLIAEHKNSKRWNLFNDLGLAFENKETKRSAIKLAVKLLSSIFTRYCNITREEIDSLIKALFHYNIVDENGKCDPHVVTPRYVMPVSEYPGAVNAKGEYESEAKTRFFRCIPCKDIAEEKLGANYEDYLYCFNYCAFSYTSQNVEALHNFIETCLKNNKVGADSVVLVPMSMGATVTSAYLNAYPDKADNHVKRVVSIVGCWQGSEVIYDLLTQNYADNSEELFYNEIWCNMLNDDPTVGKPWGNVVNFVLKLFPKKALKKLVKDVVGSLGENVLLKAPSLCALVPSDKYQTVRAMITSETVRNEADFYQDAQKNLFTRFDNLKDEGIDFSFISGYGFTYGAVTKDYYAFGFMKSAAKTNSDEIIEISSTAPGTQFVPFNETYTNNEGKELSPDKTIDISKTYFKSSSWYFYGQKHELEQNKQALSLAIELALGNIKTIDDCKATYPQFISVK